MKYVKLTARPDTWFKAGTEVYQCDSDPPENARRLTLDEWNQWGEHRTISGEVFQVLVRGLHVIDCENEAKAFGMRVGDERWDSELCAGSEFDVEIVKEAA